MRISRDIISDKRLIIIETEGWEDNGASTLTRWDDSSSAIDRYFHLDDDIGMGVTRATLTGHHLITIKPLNDENEGQRVKKKLRRIDD